MQGEFFARLGPITAEERKDIMDRFEKLKGDTKKSGKQLWYALSENAEGYGQVGADVFFENAKQSVMHVNPHSIEKAARSLYEANRFSSSNIGADALAQKAILATSQQAAGLTNAVKFEKEATAVAEVLRTRGDTSEFAQSIYEATARQNKGAKGSEGGVITGFQTISGVLEGGKFGKRTVKAVRGREEMSNEEMLDFLLSNEGSRYRDEAVSKLQGKKGSEFIVSLLRGDESAVKSWQETRIRNKAMFADFGATSKIGADYLRGVYGVLDKANANDSSQDRSERIVLARAAKQESTLDAEIRKLQNILDESGGTALESIWHGSARRFRSATSAVFPAILPRFLGDRIGDQTGWQAYMEAFERINNLGEESEVSQVILEQIEASNELKKQLQRGAEENRKLRDRFGDDGTVSASEKLLEMLARLNENIEKKNKQPTTRRDAMLGPAGMETPISAPGPR